MKTLKIFCILALILGLCSPLFAASAKRTAVIMEVSGKAEIRTPEQPWTPAKTGMILTEKDALRTLGDSFVVLKVNGYQESATVEIKPNSQLLLAELVEDRAKGTQNTLLDLALGEILIKAQKLHAKDSKFEVKTPTSVVGVRGTTFSVTVEAVR